jgi:hypothetical protein
MSERIKVLAREKERLSNKINEHKEFVTIKKEVLQLKGEAKKIDFEENHSIISRILRGFKKLAGGFGHMAKAVAVDLNKEQQRKIEGNKNNHTDERRLS